MLLIISLAIVATQQVVSPPPRPRTGAEIAIERQRTIRELHISDARIFVAAHRINGAEVEFRFRELEGAHRTTFLSLLDRPDTFYATEGVLGCIGDQYRIALLWPGGTYSESWFSPICQRVFPASTSTVAFDAALSSRGANRLAGLLKTVVGIPTTSMSPN